MQKPKLLFVGGGSGGHIFPNVALIDFLMENQKVPLENISYIGSYKGMEGEIITKKTIAFYPIHTGKLRRYFDLQNVADIFWLIMGFFQSLFLLRRIKPHLIFSKGGFVSVPVVMAGWLLRIPVVTHESDSVPGLANRIIGRFSQKIFLSFPKSHYSVKEILTGVPLRAELLEGKKEKGKQFLKIYNELPVLLVFGGSLGASTLNEFVWRNKDALCEKYSVVHLVGKGKLNPKIRHENYYAYEFLKTEIADVFACADLVLCRAGATGLVEFSLLKKPMILVPLPLSASRGEQIHNAKVMKEKAGIPVIENEKLEEEGLSVIFDLMDHSEKREAIQEKIDPLFPYDANERIWKEIKKLLP